MPEENTKKQIHYWPSMRGNERNTGCSMHDLELKKDASVRYYHTGNGIFSTPIIDGHERIFVGSADKNFYAIDPIQNNVRWKFKTKGVIDSAACLDKGGSLYVPS